MSVSYCRLPAFCIFALLVSIDANETKNIDMSTINENNIKYTSSGERAAMGGYLAQYDAFAIGVYDALEAGVLEEIRVADMEENVGKLDDVIYVTKDSVYAYQIKWSNVDAEMSYSSFKTLIPEIVDGWRKLRILYSDKTIYPYLLTNRSLTDGDDTIKKLAGKGAGGFKAYDKEVLIGLKNGEQPGDKWINALTELSDISTLTAEEWNDFWRVFSFLHDYKKERIEVSRLYENQRIFDIICINRMIQEMAGNKGFQIKLTVREIITRLNWEKRFDTKFDHNLNVPEDSYIPNIQGLTMLDAALQGKTKGYVFLKGSPGSGKSTLLTQWSRTIKNTSVRFYAFDFLNPSSQRNNDSTRGSGLTFLHDIILLIHKTGIEGEKTILPNMDYDVLRERFYSQLEAISRDYQNGGNPFVIIVDGLDHITREYSDCLQTLMKVLPSPVDIPEGVIFVLGSQHYDHLDLNPSIEKDMQVSGNLIEMPPLSKEESEHLCSRLLPINLITHDVLEKCWNKSQGHPLYLRYLLNHITAFGIEAIEALDDTPEEVEDYYARIVGTRLEKYVVRDALGLIARITGNIQLDDVRELCHDDALLDIKCQMWHLFKYDEGSQTLAFFHNSFRQYLLNKTAEDVLTGKYSRESDIDYYKRLAEYFKDGWDKGYYLYNAEEYDQFLSLMTPDYLYMQAQNFRPLWSIRRDLLRGVEIARNRRSPYLLVRYLLLENQITQMENQDYSVFSLIKEFIHTGRSTLAKAIIREGRQLHCSQLYAQELALEYLKTGDKDEANLLFTLTYPEFLSHKPEEHHNRYHDLYDKTEYLKGWVKTAGHFLDWEDIERHITVFIPYIESLAKHNQESFDNEKFRHTLMSEYLESLISQNRWEDFETMVTSFTSYSALLPVIFHALKNAIIFLSENHGSEELLNRYFAEVEKLHDNVKQSDSISLIMANLSQRCGKSTEIIMNYVNRVRWESLGSYYQKEVGQKFETIKPHIFYIMIRAKCGIYDDMKVLVPDDIEHEDDELMVKYARRVFSIAQMAGKAQAGIRDSSFLPLVKHSISYFDTLGIGMPNHNRYAYTLSQQRTEFYEFVIKMAKNFGNDMLDRVANIFEEYFMSPACKADVASQRAVALALYREGYSTDWCRSQLSVVDARLMDNKDLDGRMQESLCQGRAWMKMKCYEKAEDYFHQMIKETSGVGYRKDSQPRLFAEWLGEAMLLDSEHAIEYIHWLTSRLRYIDEIAESRTSYRAAHEMLCRALKFNLRTGLKLAFWLLKEEFEIYQSVSSAILKALLSQSICPEEYYALFRVFTDLHLYNDDNDAYDIDTSLLQSFVNHGQRILGDKFYFVLQQLNIKIKTECPENIVQGLLDGLEKMLSSSTAKEETEYSREWELQLATAEKLRKSGREQEAWAATIEALADSSSSGWARFNDGGSRLDICNELQKIDREHGRDFTIDLFARDIPGGYSYGTMQYLDEILPLLTDNVDNKSLFAEEFDYMNRILREDTCREYDRPEIEPDSSTVCEILRDWLLFLAQMPVICVAERAKIQLAHLHNETGVSILGVLQHNVHSERLQLEIGCYMVELDSAYLSDFCNIARRSALSTNYQYRLFAKIILDALKEPVPRAPRRSLPAIYDFVFPPSEVVPFSWSSIENRLPTINWKDASSVMGLVTQWVGYLSYCTGIDKRTLDHIAVVLMRKYGNTDETNLQEDVMLERHLDCINLSSSYRKAHALSAFDGMFEVAAELMDAGRVSGIYDNRLFMLQDFANIRFEPKPKPDFIARLGTVDSWNVETDWIRKHGESPRLQNGLSEYKGNFVIGEYSHLKKMESDPAIEDFEAMISYSKDCNDDNSIFGKSAFMQMTSKYLNLGNEDSEVILLRGGYYVEFSVRTHWIAINPAMAYMLGWKPAADGYFAWNNDEGERMVESIYWQSGNVHKAARRRYEVGEGWFVVATKKAMNVIRKIGSVYIHKKVLRRRGSDLSNMAYQTRCMEEYN